MMGFEYVIAIFLFGTLAFWDYVPSDNPKSMRSQTQFWMKNDPIWKFIILLGLWGGIAATILFILMDIHMGW